MNISIDTNAYIDFTRGNTGRVQIFRIARQIYVPLIVLGELRAGFAAGNQELANAANLQRFMDSPRVALLLPDDQTTHHYAQLYLQLRRNSAAIPTNDLWIAAIVVQHQLVLCTSDVHFQCLPQIPRC